MDGFLPISSMKILSEGQRGWRLSVTQHIFPNMFSLNTFFRQRCAGVETFEVCMCVCACCWLVLYIQSILALYTADKDTQIFFLVSCFKSLLIL